jgi:hypothetical protein
MTSWARPACKSVGPVRETVAGVVTDALARGGGRGHEDRGDRARCKRPAARKAGSLSNRSSRTMGLPRLRTVGAPAIDAPHRRSRRDDHAAGLGHGRLLDRSDGARWVHGAQRVGTRGRRRWGGRCCHQRWPRDRARDRARWCGGGGRRSGEDPQMIREEWVPPPPWPSVRHSALAPGPRASASSCWRSPPTTLRRERSPVTNSPAVRD